MKKKRLTWNMILVFAISFIFIFGVGIYAVTQEIDVRQERKTGEADQIQLALNSMYFDEAKIFLREDLTREEVDQLGQRIERLNSRNEKKQNLQDQFDALNQRFIAQDSVNGMFEPVDDRKPINGITQQKFVLIRDDLTREEVDQFRSDNSDLLNQQDDGLYKVLNELLDEADSQLDIFDRFNEAIDELKNDDQLEYDQLDKRISELQEKIEEISNPYLKAKLLDKLGDASQELTDAITQRKEREAEEQNASEEERRRLNQEAESRQEQAQANQESLQQQSDEAADQANNRAWTPATSSSVGSGGSSNWSSNGSDNSWSVPATPGNQNNGSSAQNANNANEQGPTDSQPSGSPGSGESSSNKDIVVPEGREGSGSGANHSSGRESSAGKESRSR